VAPDEEAGVADPHPRRGWTGAALVAALLAGAAWGAPLEPGRKDAWQPPNPDLYAVLARDGRVWAVGYWGSVLRSEDAGRTWTAPATPTHATLYGVSFADARHGWAVGQAGTVLHTSDGGDTWSAQPVMLQVAGAAPEPLRTNLFDVAAVSPSAAWAVGDLGVVLRCRDGESWERVWISEQVLGEENVPDRIFNAVAFDDPTHGWIVGEFGTTLRTNDGGETWQGARSFVDGVEDLYLFDVSSPDPRHAAVVGLAGSVLVTGDGGATWRARNVDTSAGLFAVVWTDRAGTAVGDRGEVYTTSDGGRSWVSAPRPHLFNWIRGVARDGDRLYAVGEKGLILGSDDAGASWSQLHGRKPPPLSAVSIPGAAPRPGSGVGERSIPLLGEERDPQ
jgi:photosystem II stability/assembly factor-like uncharacterized protein